VASFKYGQLVNRIQNIATSGGTTNLVYNSPKDIRFTGSLNQTVNLPNATTLDVLNVGFTVRNRSTGVITVNDASGALLTNVSPNVEQTFYIANNGSIAGVWDWSQASSSTTGFIAGENLTKGQLVYVSKGAGAGDTGRTANSVYLLDPTNSNRINYVGVVTADTLSGGTVYVQNSGFAELASSASGDIYASVTVPGGFQTTPPNAPTQWIIQVGIGKGTNGMVVNAAGSATAIYIEDSTTGTFTPANNVSSPADITGLAFNGVNIRAVHIKYYVYRNTSTTELAEAGNIRLIYKTVAGSWQIDNTAVGDPAGIAFTVTSGGQVRYTTTNMGGTGYTAKMSFTYESLGV